RLGGRPGRAACGPTAVPLAEMGRVGGRELLVGEVAESGGGVGAAAVGRTVERRFSGAPQLSGPFAVLAFDRLRLRDSAAPDSVGGLGVAALVGQLVGPLPAPQGLLVLLVGRGGVQAGARPLTATFAQRGEVASVGRPVERALRVGLVALVEQYPSQ